MYIPEEQAPGVILAVEHYAGYLRATNRDGRPYLILAELLKRKPAVPQPSVRVSKQPAKQRRAAPRDQGGNAVMHVWGGLIRLCVWLRKYHKNC